MSRPVAVVLHAAVAVLLLLAGGAVGVASVAVHRLWWGLPLAGLTVLACLVALPGGWWRRLAFAVGVAGAVAGLSPQRAEGDLLITMGVPGYVLLAGALVVLLAGIVTLRPPWTRQDQGPDDASEESAPS